MLAACLATVAPVAAIAATPEPDPDETITFEPAFVHVDADPGERVRTSVLLKNQTQVTPTFSHAVFDMAAGRSGSTAFDYLPIGAAPRGAGAWISASIGDAGLTIPAGTERRVELIVEVPADAGAGGHFGAVVFEAPDPRADAQVRLDLSVPVPVFVTVSGDYEHDLQVRARPTDRWLWRGGRATWDVELINAGDVHEPIGARLRVDGLLSGARSRDLRPAILLPGERRSVRTSFELRDAPDLLGADLRVVSETGPDARDDAPRVVVLPWWLLVVVAIGVALVAWRIRRRPGHAAHEHDWDDDEIGPAG